MDKASGGSIQRTVTYYPVAGAMRINSTLYYTLKDHLGSASVVTDASGNILGTQRYYPYGETRLSTGTIFTDKLFTGQREMAGLGIYHYQARFYSPKLGRFLSPDTIVPNFANPQSWNRYSYVLNNPMLYTDPTGHAETTGNDSEAGCRTASCIINMYSRYGDYEGMDDSLRHHVRRHRDYNPASDPELSDEDKAIVSIAMFQAAAQDGSPEEILTTAGLVSFFAIIVDGINMSPDDGFSGGGGGIGPNWTKKMLSESEVIAQGPNIREVQSLVKLYGGDVKGWKKMKGWDESGQEWHWYYHPNVGRIKVKPK